MTLNELIGERYFSGIETGMIDVEDTWDGVVSCNYVKFTLDGVHYMAVEDPEDGYRSCCRELMVSTDAPRNSFQPMKMLCSMKEPDDSWGYNNDILVLTDAVTGEVVLEIGTENYDYYYPCYHFYYHPEGMACNQVEVSKEDIMQLLFS